MSPTATPIPHTLTLTPMCQRPSGGEVVVDDRQLDTAAGERGSLSNARLRWNEETRSIVIYVGANEEQALARRTAMLVRRLQTLRERLTTP